MDQRKQLFVLIHSISARILEQWGQPTNNLKSLANGWTVSTLRETSELIRRKSTTGVSLCLFVDALDEYNGNYRELFYILRNIAKLTGNSIFRARLVLAGQPENVFKTVL